MDTNSSSVSMDYVHLYSRNSIVMIIFVVVLAMTNSAFLSFYMFHNDSEIIADYVPFIKG